MRTQRIRPLSLKIAAKTPRVGIVTDGASVSRRPFLQFIEPIVRPFLIGPVERAQMHRFRDIDNADIRRRGQIRAGARQSQHTVIGPRR